MAVFQGGTTAQLSLYIYSIATIAIFLWGLKKIAEENGPSTLLYAHLFAIDHFINTIYTTLFAVFWFVYEPHDGRRVANSDAQREMMGDLLSVVGGGVDDGARKAAAEAIWREERAFSAVVLVGGWLLKVYFILCLYSFALHLRKGTYHSLPLSRPISSTRRPYFATRKSQGGTQYTKLRRASLSNDFSPHPSSSSSNVNESSLTNNNGGIGGGNFSSGRRVLDTGTTMAETLWEEEEQKVVLAGGGEGGSESGSMLDGSSGSGSGAIGTGRHTGRKGALLRTDSGGANNGGPGTGVAGERSDLASEMV